MKKDRKFFLNNINKKIYNFSPELVFSYFRYKKYAGILGLEVFDLEFKTTY